MREDQALGDKLECWSSFIMVDGSIGGSNVTPLKKRKQD
jgi:hypothetical protein